MRNVATIMRRELAAYFTSPIGYIFMIVFVTISVGLFITSFFTFPVADMRPFFANIPVFFCVFIPAVTMRTWAEERKENTWEMLLTFPMQAWQLVIGKFAATLVFLALTLCTTVTLPVMLFKLGAPDVGTMVSSYLGTVLLGAMFLSIGIFFSGFFKDQILAFVVTLLTCFALFLVGTTFIAAYIDDYVPGLGGLIARLVGLNDHFNAFMRGVIELADIVYFIGWTVLFLFLNVLYIDRRSKAGSRLMFAGATLLSLGIGFFANWLIADMSLARFDVTEDKIYTISPASKNILASVDTPVQVKLYITPKADMPTGMTTLQQEITDKLDELTIASSGKLKYEVINLRVEEAIADVKEEGKGEKKPGEEGDKVEALEKRLLDKGVQPFAVRAMSENQMMSKLVYSSLGVAYKDNKEQILPQIMPGSMQDLEYRLVSAIYKLTREKKPVVALVAPKEAVNIPAELRRLYEQIGQQVPESEDPYEFLQRVLDLEQYEVQRVELTAASPLPEEYDTLVVVNPRALNERQRWEIGRALRAGKSVLMAVQTYEWNYSGTPDGLSVTQREENPQVNQLLDLYGLTVSDNILMDVNQVEMTVNMGGNSLNSLMGMGQPVNLPIQMRINNTTMDQDTSITSRLEAIFYLWGTAIELNADKLKQNGLEARELIHTTKDAWIWPKGQQLTSDAFEPPTDRDGPLPLMVMVKGQFPEAFAGTDRPAWPVEEPQPGQFAPPPPPDEGPAPEITPAPGQLVLLGSSEMFRKDFMQAGNLDLFMNAVDAITLGDDLVNVRGRKPINRFIDAPSPATQQTWKVVNYTLASGIIAAVGIIVAMVRRRSRDAYTVANNPARN